MVTETLLQHVCEKRDIKIYVVEKECFVNAINTYRKICTS